MTPEEERYVTLQSSINLLAGIIAQHAEKIDTILWRQTWELEQWRGDGAVAAADAARDAARNAEGLRTLDLGVSE